MASRKTFSGLSPIPSNRVKTSSSSHVASSVAAGLSKEYLEAVQSLNVDTMNHACELLLSMLKIPSGESKHDDNRDIKSEPSLPSVPEQLKEIYFRADDALQVILKQAPKGKSGMLPGAPVLSLTGGTSASAGRIFPKMIGPTSSAAVGSAIAALNSNKPTSLAQLAKPVAGHSLKSGVFPGMRRTAPKGTNYHHHHHKRHIEQNKYSQNQHQSTKKQRVSPVPPSFSSSGGPVDSAATTAPPPNALTFLAKLNNRNTENATGGCKGKVEQKESKQALDQITEEKEHATNSNSGDDEQVQNTHMTMENLSTRRKNPARGFHPNRR